MQFFINSEKYLSTVNEFDTADIVKMSGYPIDRNYVVIDEKSGISYKYGDTITIENNMSLMIQCDQ